MSSNCSSCSSSSSHSNQKETEFDMKKELTPIFISVTLFLIGLFYYDYLHTNYNSIFEYVIFLIAYFIVGFDILKKSFENIRKGEVFDENFLMSIATIGAILIHALPEAVGVMLFFKVGEFFQELAINNSKKSIKALMDTRPDFANIVTKTGIKKVDPNEVEINDVILVKVGEKIPLDGILIDNFSMFDTVALTGESVPRKIKEGENVLAGMVNLQNVVKIKVSKKFSDSSYSKIINLVENAVSKKSNSEKFITKFAKYYTPIVVVLAVLISIIPPLFIADALFKDWVYRGLIFLVISCPCALVISIPLGFFGGIGNASKNGILVKGANYLEKVKELDTIVFDKTGTLTKGVFNVVKIKEQNGFKKDVILKYAAYAETHSNHPIALSIKNHFNKKIDETLIKNYSELAGLGIEANVLGKKILLGNDKLLHKYQIEHDDNLLEIGQTQIHLVIDNIYAGFIIISDEIKSGVKEAILELRAKGIKKIVMLTGDNKLVAKRVADELGIEEVFSELLPEDKLNIVEKLKKDGFKVGFVGDGINDAPVLTTADVGFAIGDIGSDVAIESADIILMKGDINSIIKSIEISNNTKKIVWQNITLAFIVKGVVLSLGAFGLVTMWEAVFADVGVALLAILNSVRTLK